MYFVKTRNLFDPKSGVPFNMSRSKIELFGECPRCFYMDCRMGLGRPSIPAFTLNSAVDALLKNEFDLLRKKGESHELMIKYGIDAVPCNHPDLPLWRGDTPESRYVGVNFVHEKTNFRLCGMIDDVWEDKDGNHLMVDYKSTSTTKEISLEDQYKQAYKRQIEFYQYLFRHLGFKVSDTGYFVFANATKDRDKFDGRLEFTMSIIAHEGDDSWVEDKVQAAYDCLVSNKIPNPGSECEYCAYKKNSAISASKWDKISA